MSAPEQDPYGVLGLSQDATPEQIKQAYHRLARATHPDRNHADDRTPERFHEIQRAYRLLSDPVLRQEYDRSRQSRSSDDSRPARSFFQNLARRMSQRPEHGQDLSLNLELTLTELLTDQTIRLEVPTSEACAACQGLGRIEQDDGAPATDCARCGGLGRQPIQRTLECRVPAGVEDGTRLRLAGEGEAGLRGGRAGDLFVHIRVKPHPLLIRDGTRLSCRVPVPLATAIGGGVVSIPGLPAGRDLTIPSGAQPGQQFRLTGQGLPPPGGGPRGDLVVSLQVEIPVGLEEDKAKALAESVTRVTAGHYPTVEQYRSKVGER